MIGRRDVQTHPYKWGQRFFHFQYVKGLREQGGSATAGCERRHRVATTAQSRNAKHCLQASSISLRLSSALWSRGRRLACVSCSDMVCTHSLVHTSQARTITRAIRSRAFARKSTKAISARAPPMQSQKSGLAQRRKRMAEPF